MSTQIERQRDIVLELRPGDGGAELVVNADDPNEASAVIAAARAPTVSGPPARVSSRGGRSTARLWLLAEVAPSGFESACTCAGALARRRGMSR